MKLSRIKKVWIIKEDISHWSGLKLIIVRCIVGSGRQAVL